MRDTLPKKSSIVECGILNLDSVDGDGTHWTCWWKNKNKKYYFDSYGFDPPKELRRYLKNKILCSTFQVQKLGTSICGHLCVYVLLQLDKGKNFEDIIFDLYKNVSK
jgi:hypothetical protein